MRAQLLLVVVRTIARELVEHELQRRHRQVDLVGVVLVDQRDARAARALDLAGGRLEAAEDQLDQLGADLILHYGGFESVEWGREAEGFDARAGFGLRHLEALKLLGTDRVHIIGGRHTIKDGELQWVPLFLPAGKSLIVG